MAKEKYDYHRKNLNITSSDGHTKQLRFYGKTEKEAEEKRERAKLKYEMELLVVNSKTTFEKWRKEWLETYVKPRVSSSTCKEAEGVIRRIFAPTLDNMKLEDIRLLHVQRCLNDMEGKSKTYINRATIYIKQIFQKAHENDLILRNPTIGLTKPQGVTNERRALTAREIAIFKQTML